MRRHWEKRNVCKEMDGLKVRYKGKDMVAMQQGKIYPVIAIEKGWYRIMTEINEDYLFPPEAFDIIDDKALGM